MLYGLEGELVGWLVHVSYGAVLGIVFAAVLVGHIVFGVVLGVVYATLR